MNVNNNLDAFMAAEQAFVGETASTPDVHKVEWAIPGDAEVGSRFTVVATIAGQMVVKNIEVIEPGIGSVLPYDQTLAAPDMTTVLERAHRLASRVDFGTHFA